MQLNKGNIMMRLATSVQQSGQDSAQVKRTKSNYQCNNPTVGLPKSDVNTQIDLTSVNNIALHRDTTNLAGADTAVETETDHTPSNQPDNCCDLL